VSRSIAVKLHQKLVYKNKNKKYRAFNAEINDSNNNEFFFEFEQKKKVKNEIAVLFKKIINKMFKFK